MKTKRLLSLLLAVVTLFSMAIIPVSAEDEIQYTESDLHEMTAYADAVAAGHVNRLTAEEAPNTLVFANADNTKTMYYYGEDIKYTDENGNVRDKTNELTYSNGAYVNEDNDINVALPVSLADGVTLTHDDFEITMTPGLTGSGSLSTSPSTALLTSTQRGQADTVTYHSAFGANASIRYTPMYSGIKEDIILSSYTGVYSFSFLVETGGLLLLPDTMLDSDNDSMTEGNMSESIAPPRWYFAYRDDPTTPVAWFSDVYIYDSVGATATGSISVELLDDGRYALTVNADRAFLESSSTVYPVTVDPSVTINYSTIHDATISSYFGTTNYGSTDYLYVGGSHGYYSAMKFMGLQSNSVFSSISAGQIYSAKLSMYCYEKSTTNPTVIISQYSPTSASSGYWLENNITYNKCGIAYDSTNQVSKTLTSAVQYSFDITNIVKAWKGSTALIEKGLLLRAASSSTYAYFASSEYSGTNLRPYLTINYVSDGIYKIKNVHSDRYMNVANGLSNHYMSNVPVNIFQRNESDGYQSQLFRIVYSSSNDAYLLYPICSLNGRGRTLSATSSSPSNGTNIASVKNASDTAKYFDIKYTSQNQYKLLLHSNNNLAISSCGTSDGTISGTSSTSSGNIYLATDSNSNNQKWTLEEVDYSHEAYYAALDIKYPFRGSNIPVNISSDYGNRPHNDGTLGSHEGLDLNTTAGTYLYAPFSGTIVASNEIDIKGEEDDSMGYYVVIEADDIYVYNSTIKLRVIYMHMQEENRVTSGHVTTDTVVGRVGKTGQTTGNHLHISFITNGGKYPTDFNITIDPILIYDEINFTCSY